MKKIFFILALTILAACTTTKVVTQPEPKRVLQIDYQLTPPYYQYQYPYYFGYPNPINYYSFRGWQYNVIPWWENQCNPYYNYWNYSPNYWYYYDNYNPYWEFNWNIPNYWGWEYPHHKHNNWNVKPHGNKNVNYYYGRRQTVGSGGSIQPYQPRREQPQPYNLPRYQAPRNPREYTAPKQRQQYNQPRPEPRREYTQPRVEPRQREQPRQNSTQPSQKRR